jgi:hypothetical protein
MTNLSKIGSYLKKLWRRLCSKHGNLLYLIFARLEPKAPVFPGSGTPVKSAKRKAADNTKCNHYCRFM